MGPSVKLACVLAVVGGVGAAAIGNSAQPERPRREQRDGRRVEPPPPPPLRGPEVRDERPPGPGEGMVGGGGEQRFGERIPPRVFLAAVRALDDEGADGSVRLTEEQRASLREAGEEFQRQRREYMERHADELRELRALAGDGPRRRDGAAGRRGTDGPRREMDGPGMDEMPDRPPPADEGGEGADRRVARERLRDIERGAPQPEGMYKRVWADLRPEQREAVERELERFRAERARQREEAYVRQRAPGAGRPEAAPMDGAPARPGPRGGGPGAGERRERLLRIFERLSPDEQEALLERLEGRLRERGPAGRPPRGDRPPPGMDDVEVPPEPGPAPDR